MGNLPPPGDRTAAGLSMWTGYQVQLGAYNTRARAERAWNQVLKSAQDLLDGLSREVIEADLGDGRDTVYRLRAGPLPDRAGSERLCGELKARGIGCFPVRPSVQADLPETPEAAPPAQKPKRPAYQVQLGAYRSMTRARRAWTEIIREANGLLGELSREVVEVDLGADKGIYFRLRAGPLPDRAAAKRLCTELEAAGIGCFVARPSKARASTAAEPGATGRR